jgi:hypothetical protein
MKMTHPHQECLPSICFGKLSSAAYFLIILLLCRQILGSKVKIGQSQKNLDKKGKLRIGISNKAKPIKKSVYSIVTD